MESGLAWRMFRRTRRPAPRVADGTLVYAIGDIHGRVDLLEQTLVKIDAEQGGSALARVEVYLGDYIDRGPASREVLERLIRRSRECHTVFLKGNHESCALEFLENPAVLNEWAQFGALATLMSYGLRPPLNASAAEQVDLWSAFRAALPPAHSDFLARLRPSFTSGDFFFVHAGVRPGLALSAQRDQDLMWIRDDFLLYEKEFEKMIVHGHTPVREPEFRENRINIDTGAYATGRLTCLRIEGEACTVL